MSRRLPLLAAPALALAVDLAAQQATATPPTAAAGHFARVLWLPAEGLAEPARLQRARAAGFDAVNVGPGAELQAVRAAGLGYYLDQPIGKGFLELRDRDFEPLQRAYERDRDPRVLVRPQCLRDPELLQQLGKQAATAAAAAVGPGLLFVALADEASFTRHNDPLDVCRCGRCIAAFRTFLQQRHGGVQALDRAWGTEFHDWAQVEPLTTDQVRRRELGGVLLPANLQPYTEWLEFADEGFALAVAQLRAQVAAQVGGTPVGLTGLQPPTAFGGHDYARLLPGLTLVEPYDIGGASDLCRSLLPTASQWFTLGLPSGNDPGFEALATMRLAAEAARGSSGVVVWNEPAMFAADGAPSPAGAALQRAFERLQPTLDACAGAEVLPDPVWVVESAASVRAWWMLDSIGDGLTWVRRLASHEAEHSTSLAARSSWQLLLGDLGLVPRFVGERELPERLLVERPRLLVLPATIALADRAAQAIASYVQQGGTVLADHSAALYDENLRLRAGGGLDTLFGIARRSLHLRDLGVSEGRARDTKGLVAESGLAAQLAEGSGDTVVFAERRSGRGRAVYLNLAVCDYARVRLLPAAIDAAVDLRRRVRQVLQSSGVEPSCDVRGTGLPTCMHRRLLRARDGRTLLAIRLAALAAPQLLAQLAADGPRVVHLTFPRPVRLRNLAGAALGSGDVAGSTDYDLQMEVERGLFVELLR